MCTVESQSFSCSVAASKGGAYFIIEVVLLRIVALDCFEQSAFYLRRRQPRGCDSRPYLIAGLEFSVFLMLKLTRK